MAILRKMLMFISAPRAAPGWAVRNCQGGSKLERVVRTLAAGRWAQRHWHHRARPTNPCKLPRFIQTASIFSIHVAA